MYMCLKEAYFGTSIAQIFKTRLFVKECDILLSTFFYLKFVIPLGFVFFPSFLNVGLKYGDTVKPVYNSHPRDWSILAIIDRWPLYRGSEIWPFV